MHRGKVISSQWIKVIDARVLVKDPQTSKLKGQETLFHLTRGFDSSVSVTKVFSNGVEWKETVHLLPECDLRNVTLMRQSGHN